MIEPSFTGGQISSYSTWNNKNLRDDFGITSSGLVGTWKLQLPDGNGGFVDGDVINLIVTPAPVPGPLPLLGAGAAFGWSRRLRKRIATPLSTTPQA